MATYAQAKADLEAYTAYHEDTFISKFPLFLRQSEDRIWSLVQLTIFQKMIDTLDILPNDPTLDMPADFLALGFINVVDANGMHTPLEEKDLSFIREVYPNQYATGTPRYCSLQDATTLLIAPASATLVDVSMFYFYKPASITAGPDDGTTWLSTQFYDALLYGALCEASVFMKQAKGVDVMADTYDERFVIAMQSLQNLGEARNRKDVSRGGQKRKRESIETSNASG